MSPFGEFVWFKGVVEEIVDDKKVNRARVRVVGFHTEDKNELPSDLLPWAPFLNGPLDVSGPMVRPGDWVVGFFLDGEQAQQPIIIGSLPAIPVSRDNTHGFSDPSGIYPKRLNEPTTSRSARGDASDAQQHKQKTAWQNPTAFGAQYPFNTVIESDKGAMLEIDDTEGAERVSLFHHKGSYVEFLPDGTIVVKSMKDGWDVTFGNKTMLVNGNLKIGATGNIEIAAGGNLKLSAKGNVLIPAGGSAHIGAGGSATFVSGGTLGLKGSTIDAQNSASDSTGGPVSVEAPGSTEPYKKP